MDRNVTTALYSYSFNFIHQMTHVFQLVAKVFKIILYCKNVTLEYSNIIQ